MPKFTLDGREIEVPAGTTVLQAALREGLAVPYYCYHPKLSIAGNCRICLVEVEKAPKLLTSCSTVVTDGMVVRTDSPKVLEARRGVMEFLLINHPLDCPICDQAGECRLQEFANLHGAGVSRFSDDKVHKRKRVELGPHVMLDEERCILCTRCIRFCREITGTCEIDLFERGDRTVIGTFPPRPLDNPYSGNVVDICPVGALTSREFRFRSRVWFLKSTPSVCPGCARGCNIWVDVARDRVARLRPRINEEVNGHWMCDIGRHGFDYVNRDDRLTSPLVRSGEVMSPSPWKEAVARVAERLKAVVAEGGAEGIGWVLSGRMTNEEAFLVRRIIAHLGGGRLGLVEHLEGDDDPLLLRADRTPNRRGLSDLFGATTEVPGISGLAAGIRDESVRALVVLKEDLVGDGAATGLGPDDLSGLDLLVVLDLFLTRTGDQAHVVFPGAAFVEDAGTFTSFEGRLQRLQPARRPAGAGQPAWVFLTLLGRALEGDFPYARVDDVTRAIGAAVPEYGEPVAALLGPEAAAAAAGGGGQS